MDTTVDGSASSSQLAPALLVTTILALLGSWWWRKRRQASSALNLPPGPRGWKALRGVLGILRRGALYEQACEWAREYGEIVFVRSALGDACILNSTRVAREAYLARENENITNCRPASFLGKYLAFDYKDVGTTDPATLPQWIKMKKIFHKCLKFYGEGIQAMENAVHCELRRLVSKLEATSGQDVYMETTITTSVLCVLAAVLTGDHYDPDSPLLKAIIEHIQTIVYFMSSSPFVYLRMFPWLRFVPGLPYRKIFQTSIRSRDEALAQLLAIGKKDYVYGKPRGLVDRVLDEQKDNPWMTEDHVKGVLWDSLVFGFVTTSATLKWTFLFLAHHPEVMRRIQKDVEENVGERPTKVEDRRNVPIAEAVLWETIRCGKFIPNDGPKLVTEDMILDGYVIPKNTELVINNYFIQENTEVYHDPDLFLPDRFLDEDGQMVPAIHPVKQSYLPFSLGKRSCPGQNFAMSRAFLYTTTILNKFDVRPPQGSKLLSPKESLEDDTALLRPRPYSLRFDLRS